MPQHVAHIRTAYIVAHKHCIRIVAEDKHATGTHLQPHREDASREGGQRRDGRQERDERRDGRYDGRDGRRDERPGWDGRDARGPPHGYERGYERGDRGPAGPSGRTAGYDQTYAPHPQAFGASYPSGKPSSFPGRYALPWSMGCDRPLVELGSLERT